MMCVFLSLWCLIVASASACYQSALSADQQRVYVSCGAYKKALTQAVSSLERRFKPWLIDHIRSNDDVIVFDIDETLVSNLAYLQSVNYAPTTEGFYAYLATAKVVAVVEVLDLATWAVSKGYNVLVLTGRPQRFYDITKQQLAVLGLSGSRVSLRCNDTTLATVAFKKHVFAQLHRAGKNVLLHATDQCAEVWPGQSLWQLVLPNPFYKVTQ